MPGDIFSSNSIGTNNLIKGGATPITKSSDILETFGLKSDDKSLNNDNFLADLTPEEQIIWEILAEPLSKEEILGKSALNIQDFNTALSLLEIKALIKEELGEIRRKI